MENRKDLRTKESTWRNAKNEAPRAPRLRDFWKPATIRIPEAPVQVKFKGK